MLILMTALTKSNSIINIKSKFWVYKIEPPINPEKGFSIINRRGKHIKDCDSFDECKREIDKLRKVIE